MMRYTRSKLRMGARTRSIGQRQPVSVVFQCQRPIGAVCTPTHVTAVPRYVRLFTLLPSWLAYTLTATLNLGRLLPTAGNTRPPQLRPITPFFCSQVAC